MTVLYVDVSHHDRARRGRALDWDAVRRATSGVMCARATYGDPAGYSPTTRYFAEFQDGARAAGMELRGGYHNLIRGDASSIARQAEWFLRELDREGCAWAMLDIERYAELVANDLWPRWSDVLRFRDRWAKVSGGRVLTYYLPQWLWRGYLGSPDLRELSGPLIASDYGDNQTAAPAPLYADRGGDTGRGWTAYGHVVPAIWQYGSHCSVPGASSATDINAYRGTLAELTALLTGQTPETGDTVSVLVRQDGQPAVWLSNGITRRWIASPAELKAVQAAARSIGLVDATVRVVPDLTPYGVDVATLAAVTPPIDPAALAHAMLAELGDDVQVEVTGEQLTPALDAALRRVLGGVDGATPAVGG